jgi:acetyl-CoA synthetase
MGEIMSTDGIGGKAILIPPQVSYLIAQAEKDPTAFWESVAKEETNLIYWKRTWDKAFEWEPGKPYRWFVGGITNAHYSHVDYPIEKGFGNKAIYIYENAELGVTRTYTFLQFDDMVRRYAAAMRALGVRKGDRVLLYMPTRVEAIAVLHAAARIGAIATSVYAGFSAMSLRDRIELTGAKVIFTQDFNARRGKLIDLKGVVDEALRSMERTTVEKVVVLKSEYTEKEPQMQGSRDVLFEEFLAMSKEGSPDVEWVESNEPLLITPTSGTTAKPKPVVHKHGPFQVHVVTMGRWIYDLGPEDT